MRDGAEAYGGPVTAVAEAVLRMKWPGGKDRPNRLDFRNGLAHTLVTGSWSTDSGGPRAHVRTRTCNLWMLPSEKRAELLADWNEGLCEPPVPELTQLRLIEPLDCAWVAHTHGIWGCAVSQDGRLVLSASRDGDLAAWDMETGLISARVSTGQTEIRDCEVSPDNRLVVSMHCPEPITVFGLPGLVRLGSFAPPSPVDPALQSTPYGSPRRWRRFAFSPDGSQLAVAGSTAIELWSLPQPSRVATVQIEPSRPPGLLAMFFSACGGRLTAIGRDSPSPITTWDVRTGRVIARRSLEIESPWHLDTAVVTADGQFMIAANGDYTSVWRLEPPCLVASVPLGIAGRALAVSRDGRRFATASSDSEAEQPTLRIWGLPDVTQVRSWNLQDLGCRDLSCALAFAPDGRRIVIAGWEGVIRRIVLPDL